MNRKQFTFYDSFATALRRIRKKSDRCAAYDAIVDYALYGAEPDMETLPNAAAIASSFASPSSIRFWNSAGSAIENSRSASGRAGFAEASFSASARPSSVAATSA